MARSVLGRKAFACFTALALAASVCVPAAALAGGQGEDTGAAALAGGQIDDAGYTVLADDGAGDAGQAALAGDEADSSDEAALAGDVSATASASDEAALAEQVQAESAQGGQGGYAISPYSNDPAADYQSAPDYSSVAEIIHADGSIEDWVINLAWTLSYYCQPGDTVRLIDDTCLAASSQLGYTKIDKSITLDLNGHSLERTFGQYVDVQGSGDLTITDSSKLGTGLFYLPEQEEIDYQPAIVVSGGGKFTLKSGEISSVNGIQVNGSPEAQDESDYSTVAIEGGYLKSRWDALSLYSKGGSLVSVKGGTLNSQEGNVISHGFRAGDAATVSESSIIDVSGGTLIANSKQLLGSPIACAIYNARNDQVNISGGLIHAYRGVGLYMGAGNANITGGTIQTTGHAYGPTGPHADVKYYPSTDHAYAVQVDAFPEFPDAEDGFGVTISGDAVLSAERGDEHTCPAVNVHQSEGDGAAKGQLVATGGSFSTDNVKGYIPKVGYHVHPTGDDANRMYEVLEGYELADFTEYGKRKNAAKNEVFGMDDSVAFAGWYKDKALTEPYSPSDTEGTAFPKFVPKDSIIRFNGNSLRMDVADPEVMTYLRFGYTIGIPAGATFRFNQWTYYVNPDKTIMMQDAYNNYPHDPDGVDTASSNLVVTGVKKGSYQTRLYCKMDLTYVTCDGTLTTIEDELRDRTTLEVAQAIVADPGAPAAERDYAERIIAACGL